MKTCTHDHDRVTTELSSSFGQNTPTTMHCERVGTVLRLWSMLRRSKEIEIFGRKCKLVGKALKQPPVRG